MSYKGYDGTIKTTAIVGDGENKKKVEAIVDVSHILPTGLEPKEGLEKLIDKYGESTILDMLLGQGWKVPVQKAGNPILKETGDSGKAVEAMIAFADGDMKPRARVVKVKLTREELIKKLEEDGINVDSPIAKKIIEATLRA